jgi:hypothetical protein
MSLNCGSITLLNKLDCSNLDLSLDNSYSYIQIGHSSTAYSYSISIGNSSSATGNNNTVVGQSAIGDGSYSISIGSNALAAGGWGTNRIAIGGADSSANAANTDSSWNCVIGNSSISNVKFKGNKDSFFYNPEMNYADIYCNRIICREILIDKSYTEESGYTYSLSGEVLTPTTDSENPGYMYNPNHVDNSGIIAASIGYNTLASSLTPQFSVISNGNMYLKPGDDVMTSTPTPTGGGNHVYVGGGATTEGKKGRFDGSCNPVLTGTSFLYTGTDTGSCPDPPCPTPSVNNWWADPSATFKDWFDEARKMKTPSFSTWNLSRQSDHRIKQKIAPIPLAESLNKLSQTNPTSFNFKKDHIYSDDSLQHGFIAQELKEHFPEAVTVSTGYLPIDLSSVKVTYSDPSKTILSISNTSGTILVKIVDFDNTANSITLDKNIPDNFVRLRFFVDDFHYVQYDKFIPITISAIKKLKSTQRELYDVMKKLTQKIGLLEGNKK